MRSWPARRRRTCRASQHSPPRKDLDDFDEALVPMLRDVDDAIFDAEHRLAHPEPGDDPRQLKREIERLNAVRKRREIEWSDALGTADFALDLLSRKTVDLMASDHLGPALSQGARFAPGPGYGFGLTVAVRTQPGMAPYPGSVGEYNWGGAAGTVFWVDPKEQLVPIMLIQAPGQRLITDSRFAAWSTRQSVIGLSWTRAFAKPHAACG